MSAHHCENMTKTKQDFALVTVNQAGDIEVYVQSEKIYQAFGKHKVRVLPKTIRLNPAQVRLIINPQIRTDKDIDLGN